MSILLIAHANTHADQLVAFKNENSKENVDLEMLDRLHNGK